MVSTQNQSLFLNLSTNSFFYPQKFFDTAEIKIICPDLSINPTTCRDFEKQFCHKKHVPTIRRTGVTCLDRQALISHIGFPLPNEFLPVLKVCHLEYRDHTIWIQEKIVSTIGDQQLLKKNVPFSKGGFFKDVSLDEDVYPKEKQRRQFSEIFDHDEKFVNDLINGI